MINIKIITSEIEGKKERKKDWEKEKEFNSEEITYKKKE